MASLDYKLKLIEFIGLWHEYNQQQDILTQARKDGNVAKATTSMYRIIELKNELNGQITPVLNTMNEEQEAEKAKHLTVVKGGIEG